MHEARNEYAISTRTTDCIGLHEDAIEQMETEKKNEHSNGRMHV